jgi:hypothetical protein
MKSANQTRAREHPLRRPRWDNGIAAGIRSTSRVTAARCCLGVGEGTRLRFFNYERISFCLPTVPLCSADGKKGAALAEWAALCPYLDYAEGDGREHLCRLRWVRQDGRVSDPTGPRTAGRWRSSGWSALPTTTTVSGCGFATSVAISDVPTAGNFVIVNTQHLRAGALLLAHRPGAGGLNRRRHPHSGPSAQPAGTMSGSGTGCHRQHWGRQEAGATQLPPLQERCGGLPVCVAWHPLMCDGTPGMAGPCQRRARICLQPDAGSQSACISLMDL